MARKKFAAAEARSMTMLKDFRLAVIVGGFAAPECRFSNGAADS
jgi:hypothetical protein